MATINRIGFIMQYMPSHIDCIHVCLHHRCKIAMSVIFISFCIVEIWKFYRNIKNSYIIR